MSRLLGLKSLSDMSNCKVFVSIIGDRPRGSAVDGCFEVRRPDLSVASLAILVSLRYTPESVRLSKIVRPKGIALSKTLERAKVIDE